MQKVNYIFNYLLAFTINDFIMSFSSIHDSEDTMRSVLREFKWKISLKLSKLDSSVLR